VTKKYDWDKQKLEHAYSMWIDPAFSCADISRLYGCNEKTIANLAAHKGWGASAYKTYVYQKNRNSFLQEVTWVEFASVTLQEAAAWAAKYAKASKNLNQLNVVRAEFGLPPFKIVKAKD